MAILEAIPRPEPPPVVSSPVPEGAAGQARKWKWTGDDLIRMGEAGLLPLEGRFELLDGEVYQLMPPGPVHDVVVGLIAALLALLGSARGTHVREEKSIHLSEYYDPQPDVAVVRGSRVDYLKRRPGPEDLLLVVEVADSSVEHDRRLKIPVYAGAGIPECWLVNLPERRVEAYRSPVEGEYRSLTLYRSGDSLELEAWPGAALAVAELLGESAGEAAPAAPEAVS